MLNYIKEYVNDNFKTIMFFLTCIIIGLVVGIVVYQFILEDTKIELVKTLNQTLEYTKQEDFQGINVIKNGMISNIILIVIIYFGAITLIAPGIVSIINVFKGFAIGLYIPTLFQVFGFGNGVLALVLLVIIPNIIYIPTFIYLSINSLKFHYNILGKNKENKISLIFKEGCKMVMGFSVVALSVILEQFLCVWVIKIYINM